MPTSNDDSRAIQEINSLIDELESSLPAEYANDVRYMLNYGEYEHAFELLIRNLLKHDVGVNSSLHQRLTKLGESLAFVGVDSASVVEKVRKVRVL